MTRARFYPGETISLQFQARNNGNLVDPTTVDLIWRQKRSGAKTTISSIASTSTGIFDQDITPTGTGPVHYRWESTGPIIVEEGTVLIKPGKFTDVSTTDY